MFLDQSCSGLLRIVLDVEAVRGNWQWRVFVFIYLRFQCIGVENCWRDLGFFRLKIVIYFVGKLEF